MKKSAFLASFLAVILLAFSFVQPVYAEEPSEPQEQSSDLSETAPTENADADQAEEPQNDEAVSPEENSPDENAQDENASDDDPEENAGDVNEDGSKGDTEEESIPETIILDGKVIKDPVYVVLNGKETLYLSIGKAELREYVNFFRNEMNMNSAAIAGVLANIQCESGFDPNLIGDYGNSYGLCQWRETRLDGLVEFCDREGLSPITAEGQLRFIQEEFNNYYKFIGDVVLNIDDSAEGAYWCAHYFCYHYEAPSNPDLEYQERVKIAKELIYPLLVEWENN